MKAAPPPPGPEVRDLRRADLAAVIRVDGKHTGKRKPRYWRAVFEEFLGRGRSRGRVGIAAEDRGVVAGFLLAEVRAFEFGSEPCGWVFAVGVDPDRLRRGTASALLDEAVARFRAAGVSRVRTMVRRTNVPVLSFFRSNGFSAGPFVQLELGLAPGTAASGAAGRRS